MTTPEKQQQWLDSSKDAHEYAERIAQLDRKKRLAEMVNGLQDLNLTRDPRMADWPEFSYTIPAGTLKAGEECRFTASSTPPPSDPSEPNRNK